MCGVPVHAATAYLQRLIKAGHRVAIAEQTESPEAAPQGARVEGAGQSRDRPLRHRGHADRGGAARRARRQLVRRDRRGRRAIALAAADVSTGRFEVIALDAAVAAGRTRPARRGRGGRRGRERRRRSRHHAAPARRLRQRRGRGAVEAALRRRDARRVRPVRPGGTAAAGGLVAYLEHTAKGTLPFLRPPRRPPRRGDDGDRRGDAREPGADLHRRRPAQGLAARRGRPHRHRRRRAPARRRPRRAADGPGRDRRPARPRGLFHDDDAARERLRAALRALPDIGRALGRLAAGRGSPRDLGQLRDGLDGAWALGERLGGGGPPPCSSTSLPACAATARSIDLLRRAIVASPPIDAAGGGYVATGYDVALDERNLQRHQKIYGRNARSRPRTRLCLHRSTADADICLRSKIAITTCVPAPNAKRSICRIQGTASDIVKIAMLKVDEALKRENFENKDDYAGSRRTSARIARRGSRKSNGNRQNAKWKRPFELDVPLTVEIGAGKNWMTTK